MGKENHSILIWLEVSLDVQARWLYRSGTRGRYGAQMKSEGSLSLRFVDT